MGCGRSGTGCSSMGPPGGHKPYQQTCCRVGSCLCGSTGPGRSLLRCGLPTGSQPPGIHQLQCGVPSMGCGWISAPPWTSMGSRGTACLTMIFIKSCRGKFLLWRLEHLLPLLLSLTFVSAELFLSHSLTPLSQLLLPSSFFPLLKYVIIEALPLCWWHYHSWWWPWPMVGPS